MTLSLFTYEYAVTEDVLNWRSGSFLAMLTREGVPSIYSASSLNQTNVLDMGDLHRRPTQIGDIHFNDPTIQSSSVLLPSSEGPSKSKRRQLADVSPVRTLPVNVSQSLKDFRSFEHIPKKIKKGLREKPQQNYYEFISLDQAGPATIAYDDSYKLYAVKKVRVQSVDGIRIQLFKDVATVVGLYDAYSMGDEIQVVYEYIDTSLKSVLATPRGLLVTAEIAIICREV